MKVTPSYLRRISRRSAVNKCLIASIMNGKDYAEYITTKDKTTKLSIALRNRGFKVKISKPDQYEVDFIADCGDDISTERTLTIWW